jgi:adenylosuccinate synthase
VTHAFLVHDLGFGDAGKGTTVDFLVRDRGARLVVRTNGGAQAGHAVVAEDGRAHVFSQFGAGTFVPGVRTHLAEATLVHPTALLVEATRLAAIGVGDALARLTIAESARIITPYHQAANHLRERARGAERHGTCGVGVGETVRDALDAPAEVLRARDLGGDRALSRARRAQERLRASLAEERRALAQDPAARADLDVLDDVDIAARWADAVRPCAACVVPDHAIDRALGNGPVVLEGAQGVLLDERVGFHPHTTWSDCTAHAQHRWLDEHGAAGERQTLGVLRTYATRHGEGPFPTEHAALRPRVPEAHNDDHGAQGTFRVGWLDLVLARYALTESRADALVLTHLDRVAPPFRVAIAYEGAHDEALFVRDGDARAVSLRAGDLDHQERLGRALGAVRPVLEAVETAEALVALVERALDRPVALTSSGPTARAKAWRAPR